METQMNEITNAIDAIFQGRETSISRDLKLNLKRSLTEGALAGEAGLFVLLATARAAGARHLEELAASELQRLGKPDPEITEARESAAIMGMLNTYYRFRHFIEKSPGRDADYKVAGLRMTSLAKPVLGKERFESLALAVSILNGCESCIRSHEQVLRDHGMSADQIHEIARIASTVRAISFL
jgi:alkyl hydroperoxide reductase subunit D